MDKAISQEYMTVGEIAKKMGITVRTLHHYDKVGLLSPSSESEGGFRLYSDKDVVKLHQILAMKHLGFSLDDIKNRLLSLDTPNDVAKALTKNAEAIRKKIEMLTDSLEAIETLKTEVLQMETVDFKKYAAIVESLQMKNEHYWVIKHFDDDMMDYFISHFDTASAKEIVDDAYHLQNEVLQLIKEGVPPESDKGQNVAKRHLEIMMKFSSEGQELIHKMDKMFEKSGNVYTNTDVDHYIESASQTYFAKLGYDPFAEDHTS